MKKNKIRLNTRIGGIIDKLSYGLLCKLIILIILVSSILFTILNPSGNGTNQPNLGILDSLYFSLVTFTTLGYGDIIPQGWGKLIASIEVCFGLVLAAILIAKISSERQSSKLLLIYTSINNQRLSGFIDDLVNHETQIKFCLKGYDNKSLYKTGEQLYNFISSIKNFLLVQSHEGGLATYGNSPSLKRLYKELDKIQTLSYIVVRTYGIDQRSNIMYDRIVDTIASIGSEMNKFHSSHDKVEGVLNELKDKANKKKAWKLQNQNGRNNWIQRNDITDKLLELVKLEMDENPLVKIDHKEIARKIGISNSLSDKCIKIIIANKL